LMPWTLGAMPHRVLQKQGTSDLWQSCKVQDVCGHVVLYTLHVDCREPVSVDLHGIAALCALRGFFRVCSLGAAPGRAPSLASWQSCEDACIAQAFFHVTGHETCSTHHGHALHAKHAVAVGLKCVRRGGVKGRVVNFKGMKPSFLPHASPQPGLAGMYGPHWGDPHETSVLCWWWLGKPIHHTGSAGFLLDTCTEHVEAHTATSGQKPTRGALGT
jgi:hypothetical protein